MLESALSVSAEPCQALLVFNVNEEINVSITDMVLLAIPLIAALVVILEDRNAVRG